MGSSMCQATGFLLTFLGIAAIFNLTAISLFRYYVITWREVTEVIHFSPIFICHLLLQSGLSRSKRISSVLMMISWMMSLLVSVPPLLGWGRYTELASLHCLWCTFK